MSKTKEWLLVGAILLPVVLGWAHARPFHDGLVIAQAPQADRGKEKEKKRPSAPPSQQRQVQPQQQQVQPPPPPPGQERRQERQVQPPPPPPGQERRQERQVQPPLPQQRRCSRHRSRNHGSNWCSRDPHKVRSLCRFRSSNKVNAVPGARRSNRRVRSHRSSRSDSPPWHRPRFNRRLRRPDLKRRNCNAPSCHRRLRIMRPVLMMSAGLAARCARATVS